MKVNKEAVKFYLACSLMLVAVALGWNWELQNREHQKRMEMGARSHRVFLVLKDAVAGGDLETYESLADDPCRRFIPNEGLLEVAIETGRVEMVRRILRDGVPEGHLMAEKVSPSPSTGSRFYGGSLMSFTEDPVLLAASLGNLEVLQALKDAGAGFHTRVKWKQSYGRELRGLPPEKLQLTPAGEALRNGHVDAVSWLLENGSPSPNRV
ncbi:MAG TPA: hypothetical protein EYO33_31020 [Phycisphaerales bacterium]|nr:hypothetical protein [Phycisphaerales bacterium]